MDETVKRNYFAVIPADIRYDVNLTPNAKLLYGEITALADDEGICKISNAYFADLYQVSSTSISTWISSLQEAGYIENEINFRTNVRTIRILWADRYGRKLPDVYKKTSRRIEENFQTSTRKLHSNNKENDNNKKELKIKERPEKTEPLVDLNSKAAMTKKKSQEIKTMQGMISNFSSDDRVKTALTEYFNQRRKKGLIPAQWQIILDELRTFVGSDESWAVTKIRDAFAGGYMQIIASWEKGRKNSPKGGRESFDNTSGRSDQPIDQEGTENYATDSEGNPITF